MSGLDFQAFSKKVAQIVVVAAKEIAAMDISVFERRQKLGALFRATGDVYGAAVYAAAAKALGADDMKRQQQTDTERQQRLAVKVLRNEALGRDSTEQFIQSYFDNERATASEEAFRNAKSLGNHPTLTRTLNGRGDCTWCRQKAGVHVNPTSEYFKRHAHCDCKLEVSGYRTRNGEVRNFRKTTTKGKSAGSRNGGNNQKPPKKRPEIPDEPHEIDFYKRWVKN